MPSLASARRYAQAAFEIAGQRNVLDRWAQDLGKLERALETGDLRFILSHTKVPMPLKEQVARQALNGVDPLVVNLLLVLVKRRMLEILPEVNREFLRVVDQARGRERVEVVSAVALDQAERQRIESFVRDMVAKEVVLDTRVDPSVIGGLLVKVGDTLIDGSTRGRLEDLRKRLTSDGMRPAA
jgi:F-type H+-transporting ATPase subunit delta